MHQRPASQFVLLLRAPGQPEIAVPLSMIVGLEAARPATMGFSGRTGSQDGAVYAALTAVGIPGIDIAIPPRRTASSSGPSVGSWQQREAALLRIDEVGRRQWRKESGAHQQARAENGMYRFKQIVGARLRSRSPEAQRREAMIGVNILNRMTELGMPESRAVRS